MFMYLLCFFFFGLIFCFWDVLTLSHPLENLIKTGATAALTSTALASFLSCVNWKRTSLSYSILRWRIPGSKKLKMYYQYILLLRDSPFYISARKGESPSRFLFFKIYHIYDFRLSILNTSKSKTFGGSISGHNQKMANIFTKKVIGFETQRKKRFLITYQLNYSRS